jgi:hypothetical protein
MRNLDSKIHLPRFDRFKLQFHSFFAETFSTVSVISVGLIRRVQSRHVRFAPKASLGLTPDAALARAKPHLVRLVLSGTSP